MRTTIIALMFLVSCSKESTPPAPVKNCYPVTNKYTDNINLKFYIVFNGGVQVEVPGTTYSQYTVGQQICFDGSNNIVH